MAAKTGKVKWYSAEKGYGSISPDDDTVDVFVHSTAVKAAGLSRLMQGDAVAFEIENRERGRVAAVNLAVSQ